MIAKLRRLSARIDAEWKAAGYKTRDLPRIAARRLTGARPDRGFDLDALADWTLSRSRFPAACNPFGPFGPSTFTVWSNERFFVTVYVYRSPEVEVHDHDFAGAFVNLSGKTLHCTFDFAAAERIDTMVRTGEIRVASVEMIGEGDVRHIEPGSRFIHQVWHLDHPTVVLVIRTLPRTSPQPQFQYLRPAIAMETFREDWRFVSVPDRFRYTRKMTECLRDTAKGVGYIRQLIQRESPWDAASHLLENWRYLRNAGVLEDTLALGAKHQGAWFAGMADAGKGVDLFYSVRWWRLRKREDCVVLALLLTLRSWPAIRGELAKVLPDVEPADQVAESLERLAQEETIALPLAAGSRATISRALREHDSLSLDNPLRQEMLLRSLFEPA
jgi:hypothetical protein